MHVAGQHDGRGYVACRRGKREFSAQSEGGIVGSDRHDKFLRVDISRHEMANSSLRNRFQCNVTTHFADSPPRSPSGPRAPRRH